MVEEKEVYFEVEQVGDLVICLLGEIGLDGQELVHRPVARVVGGLVQPVDVHVAADPLGGGELGGGGQLGLPPTRLDAALLARGKTPGDLRAELAAQGTGLPRILWPSVANAVARSALEYTDSDIALLARRLHHTPGRGRKPRVKRSAWSWHVDGVPSPQAAARAISRWAKLTAAALLRPDRANGISVRYHPEPIGD